MTLYAASMIPNPDFSELGTSRAADFPLGNMNQSAAGFAPIALGSQALGSRAAALDLRDCSDV